MKYGYISIVPIHPLKAVTSLKSAVKKFHSVAGIGRRHSKSSSFPWFSHTDDALGYLVLKIIQRTFHLPYLIAWVVVADGEDVDI